MLPIARLERRGDHLCTAVVEKASALHQTVKQTSVAATMLTTSGVPMQVAERVLLGGPSQRRHSGVGRRAAGKQLLRALVDTIKASQETIVELGDAALGMLDFAGILNEVPIISVAVKALSIKDKFIEARLKRNCLAMMRAVANADQEALDNLRAKLEGAPEFAEDFADTMMALLIESQKPINRKSPPDSFWPWRKVTYRKPSFQRSRQSFTVAPSRRCKHFLVSSKTPMDNTNTTHLGARDYRSRF